jgi:hypothetical protein
MIASRGMGRECSTNGKKKKKKKKKNACKLMVGKSESKSLGRPRYRSVDNIKIDVER